MYAVITSGNKQEKVAVGQQVRVDVLDAEQGSEVQLQPVLVVDGDEVLAGADQLSKATVSARVVGTAQGPKIEGFTYKRRTRNRRRFGHRQRYSVVEITAINAR